MGLVDHALQNREGEGEMEIGEYLIQDDLSDPKRTFWTGALREML
jgi:hypothetical protein